LPWNQELKCRSWRRCRKCRRWNEEDGAVFDCLYNSGVHYKAQLSLI